MNITSQRIHNQWLDDTGATSVSEVVRHLGAVQAQEYIPSLWGLGVRLGPTARRSTVEWALEEAVIVRTWLMRGTIHYVAAQDASWMVRLLGPRVNKKYRPYYERVGLSDQTFTQGKEILLRELSQGKLRTRKELYEAFEQSGIAEPSKRGRGSFILQYWAQEGLVCFGPYRGKQQTFVLLDDWVSSPNKLEGDAALAELTRRYFASHGPATPQDFAWWSGLSAAEVREGIALIDAELVCTINGTKRYYVTKDTSSSQQASHRILLLPCFDEYTVGYKDRSAVVDSQFLQQLGYAVNYNNVLVDGCIVGTWKSDDSYSVAVDFIDTKSIKEYETAIEQVARQYAQFMMS